jgi:hypothetical protein
MLYTDNMEAMRHNLIYVLIILQYWGVHSALREEQNLSVFPDTYFHAFNCISVKVFWMSCFPPFYAAIAISDLHVSVI